MTIRTIEQTVIFTRPFMLGSLDGEQPAGIYCVEADEELLEGLSFLAYRRVQTLIHLHPKAGNPGLTQTMRINPDELDAALQRDQAPADIPVDRDASRKTPDGPGASRWAEADRQAVERGEDEGMIIQSAPTIGLRREQAMPARGPSALAPEQT